MAHAAGFVAARQCVRFLVEFLKWILASYWKQGQQPSNSPLSKTTRLSRYQKRTFALSQKKFGLKMSSESYSEILCSMLYDDNLGLLIAIILLLLAAAYILY